MAKLFLIRGLPGSGKSTLAKKMLADGRIAAYYEADMYFMKDGNYDFDPTKLPLAHRWCYQSAIFDLEQGKDVAVSNTFTMLREMDEYVHGALWLNGEVEIIQCRGNYGSTHAVPESTMQKMRNRFVDNENLGYKRAVEQFPKYKKIEYSYVD